MTYQPELYLQNRIRTFSTLLKVVIPLIFLYSTVFLWLGMREIATISYGLGLLHTAVFFLIRQGRYITGLSLSLLFSTLLVTFENILFGAETGFIFVFFIILVAAFILIPRGYNNLLVVVCLFALTGIFISMYAFDTMEPYYRLDPTLMMAMKQSTIFLSIATILVALIYYRKWSLSYESEIAQQQHFINSMYGSFSNTHMLINEYNRIQYVNAAGAANREQFWRAYPKVGDALIDISPDEFREGLRERLDNVRAENRMEEWNVEVAKDQETRYLSIVFSPVTWQDTPVQAVALSISDLTERYILEKGRLASELRYRELVESLQEIVLETNLTGRITYLNRAWETQSGYKIAESLGYQVDHFVNVQVLRQWEEALQLLDENRNVPHFELSILAKSGEERFFEVHVNRLVDQVSGVPFVRATLYDITQRMLDEQLLSEAGKMARIGAWSWTIQTGEVYWSDHTLRIFGRKPGQNHLTIEESMGYYADIGGSTPTRTLEQIREDGNRTENVHRVRLEDGSERWVKVVGILEWAGDTPIRMSGMVQDITEEKKSREELEASKALLDSINQNIGDGVYRSSEDEGLLYANKALLRMFGYESLEEMKQVPSIKLYVNKDYREKLMGGAARSGDKFHDEVEYVRKDGTTFWGSFNSTLTIEPDGTKIFDGSIRDITELRKAREEMRDARDAAEKATKVKAEFLSTMSHEIRTPMNAVIGMTELLLLEGPRPDQLDHLQTLKFSAENLLNIINDILDYSKIEAGRIELESLEINLKELARNIVQGFRPKAQENRTEIEIEWGEGVPEMVLTDRVRISQILSNLVNNAVKFTKEGKVNLCTRLVAEDADSALIHFCVCDSGIGIPEERQQDIFERFTQANSAITREYGGTGLGLAITKKLVELMGGDIQVRSEIGKGSEFAFDLNLKKAPLAATHTSDNGNGVGAEYEFASFRGKRTLLVEDNAMNVKLALRFLSRWDMETDVAGNGQEALELVAKNKYDIILMDIQMPVMDGYTAAQQIRKANPDIPILALTASVLLDVQVRIKASGMNDSILKPINPKEFNQKLQRYLSPDGAIA
jgi:PAS domain S-box-containing protein